MPADAAVEEPSSDAATRPDQGDAGGSDTRDAADAADVIDAATRKRLFVTAATFTGKIGGSAGADAKCAAAAKAVPIGGHYVAWISTAATNAIDRITAVGPWYSVDQKTLLFTGKTTGSNPLVGLGPAAPISLTERGQALPTDTMYWTGTKVGGVVSPETCSDWTDGTGLAAGGNLGETGETSALWTFTGGNLGCNTLAGLLCIEQ